MPSSAARIAGLLPARVRDRRVARSRGDDGGATPAAAGRGGCARSATAVGCDAASVRSARAGGGCGDGGANRRQTGWRRGSRRCGPLAAVEPRRRRRPARRAAVDIDRAAGCRQRAGAEAGGAIGRPAACGRGRTEVDQAVERIEDGIAAAAAHPAVGRPQLILDDAEYRAAGNAAGRQGHRRHRCRSAAAAARSSGSSRPRRRRPAAQPRRIGGMSVPRPGARGCRPAPAGRRRARWPHSSGASSFSGVARILASTSG